MAENMVRKQIYLLRRQNMVLKRLAKQRGISEAEVIRQALERESEIPNSIADRGTDAWRQIQRFVNERKAKSKASGIPARWNRQDIYEERENRSRDIQSKE